MPAKDTKPSEVLVSAFLCRDVESVGQQGSDRGVALTILTSICSEVGVEQSLQPLISFTHVPSGPPVEFKPTAYLVDEHQEKVEGTDLIHGGGAISLGAGDGPLTFVLALSFVPTYHGRYWLRVDLNDALMAMTPIVVEPPAYTDPGGRTVMDSGAPTYTFLGTVLRANQEPVTIARVRDGSLDPIVVSGMTLDGSLQFDASIRIVASRIEVSVSNPSGGDHSGIGNYVERVVRVLLDAHGYTQGHAYDVVISHYIDHRELDSENWVRPFAVGALPLPHDAEVTFDSLLPIVLLEPSRIDDERRVRSVGQLTQALGDIREAIRNPHDTALHSYRAIEDIRQCYVEPGDASEDARPSWKRMSSQLRIERSWIEDLTKARNPQAHGDSRMLSGEQRAEFVSQARVVIDRFIISMRNGFEPLSDEFEILT